MYQSYFFIHIIFAVLLEICWTWSASIWLSKFDVESTSILPTMYIVDTVLPIDEIDKNNESKIINQLNDEKTTDKVCPSLVFAKRQHLLWLKN